jgi:putative component of membrane protein insertase Oxa1/YidC/SpoIIIJ protein YidD
VKNVKRNESAIHRGTAKGRFHQLSKRISGVMNRFFLPWIAYLGLFTSTSTCPCCGQPACPAGAVGMGLLAGFLVAVTGFFKQRQVSQPEITSKSTSGRPEIYDYLNIPNHTLKYRFIKKIKFIGKSCLFVLLWTLAIQACAHTSQNQTESMMANDSFYQGVIEFYGGPLNHLKSVRRGECPMYPSCSEYSRQAIARFGLIKGWVMTMDRLIRCGRDEIRIAPKIWVNGKWKYYDPIENNNLWHGQTKS